MAGGTGEAGHASERADEEHDGRAPAVDWPRGTRAGLVAAVGTADPPAFDLDLDHHPRRLPRLAIPPRTAVIALLALALVVGAAVLRTVAATPGVPVELAEPRATATSAPADPEVTEAPTLLVHVVGQVASPGLVELASDARVSDALDAAGGPLPDADLAALNLAASVSDGDQIRVPAPGEQVEAPQPAAPGSGDGLIDLNRASATELQGLPGVGPVLAERIVADREAQGPYASVDDLDRVSGIGPAILANLRSRATV
ncbi:ComEA family DNA-binding protein [Cellulomonas denverensis]|uniref:ComEA family DNA-binding protein n=1 Tax=Cellulomonas denverensis TaxID=264297 RepID=A0A7X6R0N3_9CELL|nr:ComEA family DNA-binding protein [Cellulomonas denverensis]